MEIKIASPAIAAILTSGGCSHTNQNRQLTALSVSPPSATADHTVAAPGNQAQFFAGSVVPKGCSATACVNCSGQTWTVSDPVNVSISNNAEDNGTATCLGATHGAVTITAMVQVADKGNQTVTGTATLTCR